MSRNGKNDWARKIDRVCLGDCLAWCEAIQDDHGYWVRWQWCPPLPSQRGKNNGTVTLWLERWEEGQYASRVARIRTLPLADKRSLEVILLELLSALAMALDRGQWEEERASLDRLTPEERHQSDFFGTMLRG